MRVSRIPSIVVFFLLGACPDLALADDRMDAAAVDALMQHSLRVWQVPGAAVAIVRNDRVIYLKGYGVKALGSGQPVTPDTIFPLGSCTKAFTTAAMAMLVDAGKMSWDDHVRHYVDFFHLYDPLADAQVTLRDLVTHRTGLGGNELLWYRSPWSQKEIIRRIGWVKPAHSFRSTFQYQTTMFATAGYAVGQAAQTTWADFVRQRIFKPLGMVHATVTTTEAKKNPDHASPQRRNRSGAVEVISWYEIPQPDPAGSINASARDLAQWVRFQLGDGCFEGKRLVSAKNLLETHTPQIVIRLEGVTRAMNPDTLQMSYGMGWVIQDYRGHLLISHGGAIDGFRAHITLVPKAKLGIVLLNNLDHTQMNLAVSNSIVDRLLGLPKKDWNAYLLTQVEKQEAAAQARVKEREARRHHGAKPSRELAAYTGNYQDPAYGTATITLENGSLVWKWSTFTNRLVHYHYDTFTIDNELLGHPQVMFALDRDGDVSAMKVMDVMDVEFKKARSKAAAR